MSKYFSKAEITPKHIKAGDSVDICIRLTVTDDFTTDNSRIVLDMPAYLGYSRPTVGHLEQSGAMFVMCSNPDYAYKQSVWDMEVGDFPSAGKTSFMGMAQRMYVLDFYSGEVQSGDTIEIHWGFTRNGFGVGVKVTTLALKPDFVNTIHARYFSDPDKAFPDFGRSFLGYNRPVPDEEFPLEYTIHPREPKSIRHFNNLTSNRVVIRDRFANVCHQAKLEDYCDDNIEYAKNDYGVIELKKKIPHINFNTLPSVTTPDMQKAFEDYNIYFGDLHIHSSFSNDCIEREKQEMDPADQFNFAKQVASLDFAAVTDHHQPWDVERNQIQKHQWEFLKNTVTEKTADKFFIPIGGFEYRCVRGDTVVLFENMPEFNTIHERTLTDIRKVWEYFDNKNMITIPHFHNGGNLGENEWFTCPDMSVEPVEEIFSCHGSFECEHDLEHGTTSHRRKDRNGNFFLQKDIKYGLCANSDGHKGNPGTNGLTAVFAPELTRQSLFNAIRNRQTYASTNSRILLVFSGNDKLMGNYLENTDTVHFHLKTIGELPIKAVDIIKNGELYKRMKPDSIEFETDLTEKALPGDYFYTRVIQKDDNTAWSSPIFIS